MEEDLKIALIEDVIEDFIEQASSSSLSQHLVSVYEELGFNL